MRFGDAFVIKLSLPSRSKHIVAPTPQGKSIVRSWTCLPVIVNVSCKSDTKRSLVTCPFSSSYCWKIKSVDRNILERWINHKQYSIDYTKCLLSTCGTRQPVSGKDRPPAIPFPSFRHLTHWGGDNMDAVSQTTLWSAFSSMKMFEFGLKFHWSLFLRVQLTISHHWFR